MGMQEVGIRLSMDTSSVVSSAQNVADAFSKISAKIKEAQEVGDDAAVERYAKIASSLQGVYNGMANPQAQSNSNSSTGGSTAGNVAGIAHSGSSAVQSVVNQAGRGDVMGAALSGAQGSLDIVGKLGDKTAQMAGIAGATLIPFILGNMLTGFYEQQIDPAMNINGRLQNTLQVRVSDKEYEKLSSERQKDFTQLKNGDWLETEEARRRINSTNIEHAFDQAAKAAISFGYSMEEGMELVKSATQYGFTSQNIYGATRNVFGWSRMTGVDTGTLMDFKGKRFRYGDDVSDSLSAAFGLNSRMGMQRGQFQETLQAISSIFEDGINKGFVKGTAEIGGTLVALYNASGKSKLWEGEQGAKRYMQMSNAVAGATALGSVTDILSYRAASRVSDDLKARARKNADINGSYGYIDNMIVLESGVSADLLNAQKKAVEQMAGKDNKTGQIELYKQMYGLNYTGSTKIFEMMQQGINAKDIEKEIKNMQINPDYLSDERASLKLSENIRSEVANIGKNLLGIKTTMESLILNLPAVIKGDIGFFEALSNIKNAEVPISSEVKNSSEYKDLTHQISEKERLQGIIKQKLNIYNDVDPNAPGAPSEAEIREETQKLQETLKTTNDEIRLLKEEIHKLATGEINVNSYNPY